MSTSSKFESLAEEGRMTEAGAEVEGLDAIIGMSINKGRPDRDTEWGTLSFRFHLKSGKTIVQSDDALDRNFEQLYIDFTDRADDEPVQFIGWVRPTDNDD